MSSVYYARTGQGFKHLRAQVADDLLENDPVHTGEWQSMDTGASPVHATRELTDVTITCDFPSTMMGVLDSDVAILQRYFSPDLPWADEHFAERVSGEPFNPPPSHVDWPYAVRGNADHVDSGKFDHTYPERYWPKQAGFPEGPYSYEGLGGHRGIRFAYGDLADVVDLLVDHPGTRQAYLPVWFPEDTGGRARDGSPRVPCSLGYHFMIREGRLSTRYYLRSCDVYRHFTNDMYLTARLALWVVGQVNDKTDRPPDAPYYIELGTMTSYISSLHSFVADDARLHAMMG